MNLSAYNLCIYIVYTYLGKQNPKKEVIKKSQSPENILPHKSPPNCSGYGAHIESKCFEAHITAGIFIIDAGMHGSPKSDTT